VVLGVAVALWTGCGPSETQERYYHNYEQLEKAHEPGNWFPSFVPQAAVELRVKYNVDSGAELLTFYFRDKISLESCNTLLPSEIALPSSQLLSADWWPNSLFRDRTSPEQLQAYVFYRCERQAFLALRQTGDRQQALFWRFSHHRGG
jgi:hypothetical protein